MDPLYASSVLSSASRQVTDPQWPAAPHDREMTSWSPAEQPQRSVARSVSRIPHAVVALLRTRIGRLNPAPNR